MLFAGIKPPEEFRLVTPAHIIAWRDDLGERILNGTTIRHRLAALSSLFQYLCDKNAVSHNPVKGVKRPRTETHEGKTPAIADHQARKLLVAPAEQSLKGTRDRAILATLLYHALRREELCKLTVRDLMHERGGVRHLRVSGQGRKDALRATSWSGEASDRGLLEESRTWRGWQWRALSSTPQQPRCR
jgi:integrase/recombinase XerD